MHKYSLYSLVYMLPCTHTVSAQFTCYSAVGCNAGNELTRFTTAEACCLSVNGLSFNDGTCRDCVGKVYIAKSPIIRHYIIANYSDWSIAGNIYSYRQY